MRIFNREAALRFFGILPDGFSFTTTITLGMLTNGYLVDYVPINYHARVGRSKIRPIQDTLNFIQLVLRIALYFKPLKVFAPFSAALFVAGAGVGGVQQDRVGAAGRRDYAGDRDDRDPGVYDRDAGRS